MDEGGAARPPAEVLKAHRAALNKPADYCAASMLTGPPRARWTAQMKNLFPVRHSSHYYQRRTCASESPEGKPGPAHELKVR